jgi:hypothetical protein
VLGRAFQIRYPNGDFEIAVSQRSSPPVVGETMRRRGRLWRVRETSDGEYLVLHVEAVAKERAEDGAS